MAKPFFALRSLPAGRPWEACRVDETAAHRRVDAAQTNFDRALPSPQSDLARDILKDPYTFDFLGITDTSNERPIEKALLLRLRDFLMELGVGFAFVGSQYRLEVDGRNGCARLVVLLYPWRSREWTRLLLKKTDPPEGENLPLCHANTGLEGGSIFVSVEGFTLFRTDRRSPSSAAASARCMAKPFFAPRSMPAGQPWEACRVDFWGMENSTGRCRKPGMRSPTALPSLNRAAAWWTIPDQVTRRKP